MTSRCRSRRVARMLPRTRPTSSPSTCSSRGRTRSATTTARALSCPPTVSMVDKANLLTLTVPEMTVLIGGMRALDANAGGSDHGVFTDRPGTLSNDFFVNLLSMSTEWSKSPTIEGIYEGRDRDNRRAQMDGHPRRPGLRFACRAPCRCRSLRSQRRGREVRQRLRRCVDQGDDPRPLRHAGLAGRADGCASIAHGVLSPVGGSSS